MAKSNSSRICTLDNCIKPHYGKGFCGAHYKRWKKYGDPTHRVRAKNGKPLEFLLDLVADPPKGRCVFWPFARMSNGYATISSKDYDTTLVHRIALTLHSSKPPTPRHDAAHNCGNGHLGCINPLCLRWATRKDNFADKVEHKTHHKGSEIKQSKLTEDVVLSIYSDKRLQADIAAEYGIAQSCVSLIKNGHNWAWLTGHTR